MRIEVFRGATETSFTLNPINFKPETLDLEKELAKHPRTAPSVFGT